MAYMDFSYLRPPASVAYITHAHNYIHEIKDGSHRRRIFYDVPLDPFEANQIQKLKNYLRDQRVACEFDDQQLLKFCYSGDFDLQKSIEKIKIYQEWMQDPQIQTPSAKSIRILEEGVFYCYGRDFDLRPVIIFNIGRMDLNINTVEDYYCALNTLLKPVREFMLMPGKVESWVWIVDTESKISLPVTSASAVISKMGSVYSSTLHKLFAVNSNTLISLMYSGIKRFIHQETVDKIEVLTESEQGRLLEFIPADELEEKFGGNLPNLRVFWPIKSTNKLVYSEESEMVPFTQTPSQMVPLSVRSSSSKTSYYSIVNDDDRFLEAGSGYSCCCSQNPCLLF